MIEGTGKNIVFRPKDRIVRYVPSKERDLVVFYPTVEYHGHLSPIGAITSDNGKYEGTYKLRSSEIEITLYL